MAIPELIPICHDPGYRTSTIGRYDDGQFFGCITGAFPPGYEVGSDWHLHKRWYAVLHRFNYGGYHLGSDIWCPGPGPWAEQQNDCLARWLDALPGREFCGIAIRPFKVEFEGVVFGLLTSNDFEYAEGVEVEDWAELYPNQLGFKSPWDGCYDT
ncbi:hypothetical protein GCM10009839_87730 [Catenulispora yoronensis]|uniref:Uncharacterized protein n=1 Tax=Catenulispora yoronensis TaxID=450799 RepID=A0ABN2VI16_9ACTN